MDRHNQSQSHQKTHNIYQSVQPKILVSSSTNNTRETSKSDHHQNHYERPMMLNSWTQTSNEDFNSLASSSNHNDLNLLAKICNLEEELRVHSTLISQLSEQRQHKERTFSTGVSSVINHTPKTFSESINYTIVSEGISNETVEPIEITLADETGAMNTSSSVDSTHLKICLSDDHLDVKRNAPKPKEDDATPSAVEQILKRPKLEDTEEEPLKANYYVNEEGFLTPIASYSDTNSVPLLKNTKATPKSKGGKKKETSNAQSGMSGGVEQPKLETNIDNAMVAIGPNNTKIPAKIYENMSWASPSIATRKLLVTIFNRKTLATHSMTGKPSPAFRDSSKPLKEMLNPSIVQDIVFVVTRKCSATEKEVRNAITTKCADENKMLKLQLNKSRMLKEDNKENVILEVPLSTTL